MRELTLPQILRQVSDGLGAADAVGSNTSRWLRWRAIVER